MENWETNNTHVKATGRNERVYSSEESACGARLFIGWTDGSGANMKRSHALLFLFEIQYR